MQCKNFLDLRIVLMAVPMLVLSACSGREGAGSLPVDAVARVEGIEPVNAVVGQAQEFTVTGQRLPLTAVLSLADGVCQTPTTRTSGGFKVACTPGGPGGVKLLTVKTDLQASDGTVIDSTRSVKVAGIVPGTGVTSSQCYAAGSDALVSCASAAAIALNDKQDGMAGRDVSSDSDSKLGFSYSTVDRYTKEECVKDNITGLTWEGKPPVGTRAANKIYTNYGDSRAGDASAYVATVNAAKLCGYIDWRLPTADELQSIVDYGVDYPGTTVNSAWFVNTAQTRYWTSSLYEDDTDGAFCVNFHSGSVVNCYRGYGKSVRLVR